jgi:hypothetical protein
MVSSFLQPSLLEDTVQSAWREVVAWFPGNRDASGPGVVFELAMAARVATSRQPSSCSILSISLTFTWSGYQGSDATSAPSSLVAPRRRL